MGCAIFSSETCRNGEFMVSSRESLDALAQGRVPFVVIGGHAVNFHGYLRTTEDADVIFLRTHESETSLLKVLQSIHACWISDERDPQTKLERLVPVSEAYILSQHVMLLHTDFGFLDIYDFVPGFPDTPVPEILAASIPWGELRFVSLHWLRKMKEKAARHKDLDDLENLPRA
ncbi:MAG: hypothetical protein NT105_20655 [Verrucomicrobia bacterium]|nr:hypothetical protein [Verrucomicrobiota bacterium]